jgi:hypothetical protein
MTLEKPPAVPAPVEAVLPTPAAPTVIVAVLSM